MKKLAVRTPYFTILPEYVLTLILMALLVLAFTASLAKAETSRRVRKTQKTITTVESESDGEELELNEETPVAVAAPVTPEETEISTIFGSKATTSTAGCKTEELNKGVIRDLKGDCKAWVKDQKADLKKRFRTSTCEESCTDCGVSLQRCTVTGTVRYVK